MAFCWDGVGVHASTTEKIPVGVYVFVMPHSTVIYIGSTSACACCFVDKVAETGLCFDTACRCEKCVA